MLVVFPIPGGPYTRLTTAHHGEQYGQKHVRHVSRLGNDLQTLHYFLIAHNILEHPWPILFHPAHLPSPSD